jgi:hypothetical protein
LKFVIYIYQRRQKCKYYLQKSQKIFQFFVPPIAVDGGLAETGIYLWSELNLGEPRPGGARPYPSLFIVY